MRIVLLGGTNFIGPAVVRILHSQGHDVTVYHRGVHEPELPSDVRHIHSPGAEIPVLHFPPSLTEPAPDVVLHMFPVGEDDTLAAVNHFAGVAERIVGISSGDVYRAYGRLLGSEAGPPEPVPLAEDAPTRTVLFPYRQAAAGPADWTYHYEKLLVEQTLLSGPIPATVLRLPAVYGPGDPYRRLRPYIKRILDGRPAILLERAQAAWRWTHGYVEDIAHGIVVALTDGRSVGKIYNLGESAVPTVAERVRRIGTLMGWTGTTMAVEKSRLPRHLLPPYESRQDLVMDTRKIRAELGFSEMTSVDDALGRTIAWEQDHPLPSQDPGPDNYATEDAVLSTAPAG
jgi:nucleoside-diphosphate-sugar epimerase